MKTRREQMSCKGSLDSHANFLCDDSEYLDWYGVAGQSRDSGCLERSNFRCILEALGGESATVRVERYGHWAVGWIEEIYVAPDSEAFKTATAIHNALEDYPVVDEEDFLNMETEEALSTWQNYFSNSQRIEYIREYRRDFEFRDFADLLGCVRGKYFSGDTSRLLD